MIDLEFSFDSSGLERALALAPARLFAELQGVYRRAGAEHEAQIIQDLRAGGGDTPKLGSNNSGLRNSFRSEVSGTDVATLKMVSYSTSVVARAHELGADISPKNAQNLTIPIGGALTQGGRKRGGIRRFKGRFITSKSGNGVFVGKDGPLFVLKKRVRLRARPFFFKAFQKLEDRRAKQVDDAVARVLEGI